MPVLKVYKNGAWENVSGVSGHTHTKDDITDFPSSLPANGGDADTLDGKHADEFALIADIEALNAVQYSNVATVGQVLAVKAVDSNGKPTEWEAVNILSATDDGSGNVTIS